MSPIAALDLGGTMLRTGWWQDGTWLRTTADRTVKDRGQAGLIAQIVDSVRSGPRPSGLVVATAGTLSPVTGQVHRAANLPLENVGLKDLLEAELGIPVAILGDATAATVAEFVVGAAQGVPHGVYITVSTGIGSGVVVRGALVSGSNHQAGELGHIPVDLGDDAPKCLCGQRGCLELFSSGSGLVARFAEAQPPADPRLDARAVLALAEQGQPSATEVVERGSRLLGGSLAVLTRLLSPEILVLGGGLARSHYYMSKVIWWLGTILADSVPGALRSVRTSVCEPSNALVGAALAGARDPAANLRLGGTGFECQLEGFS